MLGTKMIGNKIAEARKKINISQAELAQRLFISSQAVGKWERGESMPDIITFNRLAEILGVDLNYFSENFQSREAETNSKRTIDIGDDIEEKVQDVDNNSPSVERQVLANFSGSNLPESDFAGVTARNGKFYGSALRGSDFSGADLSGSSFKASDVRDTNFDNADLTDCNFYALDLSGASFHQSILVRTNFSTSALAGAKFSDVKLTDVKLTLTDLRKSVFENCIFDGVDFDKSDMRGMCLDGMTFIGVKFDNTALKDATFKGATLKNVSFRAPHALTNKYYRTIKAIKFDGAMMDKLSYNTLKSMGADLDKVNII
jgi:uncharacterized protein YjbI with pentapeptide repeats